MTKEKISYSDRDWNEPVDQIAIRDNRYKNCWHCEQPFIGALARKFCKRCIEDIWYKTDCANFLGELYKRIVIKNSKR
jgi:hypothetical protein